MSIATTGIHTASARFEAAAAKISGAHAGNEAGREIDLPTLMVTMSLASYDFKAAAKVAKIGRDTMQAALDMIA